MVNQKAAKVLLVIILSFAFLIPAGCGTIEQSTLGWVYAGLPVSGMKVRVNDTSGKPVFTSNSLTVNENGVILKKTNKQFPSEFRIIAEGGTLNGEAFAARLSGDVRDFNADTDTIYINITTTMVSAYLDKHPETGLVEAEDAVRKFLQIPESVDLASGTQLSSNYFNNEQFLNEAAEHGGMNPFIEILLKEMDSGAVHPFQKPLPPQGGAAAWLATTLAEGAVSYVGGELMGWGLSKAGVDFGEEDHTAEELAKIEQGMAEMKAEMNQMNIKLDGISDQLKNIKTQLEKMLKQITHQQWLSEYGNRVGQLDSLISSINIIRRDLNDFVNNTPANPEERRQRLINRIEANIIDQAEVIHLKMVGSSGEKPLITLWREIVYEDRFLDSYDYDKVKAQFDLFKQYQDAILLLQVEYYHAIETAPGENEAIIMDCIRRYESHIEQQEALLAQPIEKYTVIDTRYDVIYYSENIELGTTGSLFSIGRKKKSEVMAYMNSFAAATYARSSDWKPLDNVISSLLLEHNSNIGPHYVSDYLIARGWPGISVQGPTIIPFYLPTGDFNYIAYTSSYFKKVNNYPDVGLDMPDLDLIMAYRRVNANEFGYNHLKN